MKQFKVFQVSDDYLQVQEIIEVERPTKEHAEYVEEKYGKFDRYIYRGFGNETADIVGYVHVKELSPLKKVYSYIFKENKDD